MSKWPSKLSPLLRLKKLREYQALKGLSGLIVKHQWFADRLISLDQERIATEERILKSDGVLQHDEAKNYLNEIEATVRAIKQEMEMLSQMQEEKQAEVVEKRKERKIVENIWQRRYTAWQKKSTGLHG